MKTYLEAYYERMQRNHDALINLANEVLNLDPTIEVYICRGDRLQNGIKFIKGETINSVQFSEVPYHWSGCNIKNHGGGENISMPFDSNDVLTTFKPITSVMNTYKDAFKNRAEYLKNQFYLVQLELPTINA